MRYLRITLVLALGLLAAPLAAEAQQARKVPRIEYLILSPLADPPSARISGRAAARPGGLPRGDPGRRRCRRWRST